MDEMFKSGQLDELKSIYEKAFVFKNSFAVSPITLPSNMSLFTGLYPLHHKIFDYTDTQLLDEKIETLPLIFKKKGFMTTAFFNLINNHLGGREDFRKGFDHIEDVIYVPSRTQKLMDLIKKNEGKNQFFYLHNDRTHDPYLITRTMTESCLKLSNRKGVDLRREVFTKAFGPVNYLSLRKKVEAYWSLFDLTKPQEVEELKLYYRCNIIEIVRTMNVLIKAIEDNQLADKTLLLFTSDHGEAFGENGNFRHTGLNVQELSVPMIYLLPNKLRGESDEWTSHIDILPTLMGLLGWEVPKNIDGINLSPVILGQQKLPKRLLYSEFFNAKAVLDYPRKMILKSSQVMWFYELDKDPKEQSPKYYIESPAAEELRKTLIKWRDGQFVIPSIQSFKDSGNL
ncbi:MAG: hypothetical protein OHK0056_14100 [Bacteriovoracaceae bacterium]